MTDRPSATSDALHLHATLLANGTLLAKREIEWRAKELAKAWLARESAVAEPFRAALDLMSGRIASEKSLCPENMQPCDMGCAGGWCITLHGSPAVAAGLADKIETVSGPCTPEKVARSAAGLMPIDVPDVVRRLREWDHFAEKPDFQALLLAATALDRTLRSSAPSSERRTVDLDDEMPLDPDAIRIQFSEWWAGRDGDEQVAFEAYEAAAHHYKEPSAAPAARATKDFAGLCRPAVKSALNKAEMSLLGKYPDHYKPILEGEANRMRELLDEIDAILDGRGVSATRGKSDG